MRLIDADALLKTVPFTRRGGDLTEYTEGYLDCAEEARNALANAPTVDAASAWISVEDRLPEEPFGCLLTVWDSPPMGGEDFLQLLPYFAGWDGDRWNDRDGLQVPLEVAYWMPLPGSPEDKEDNND